MVFICFALSDARIALVSNGRKKIRGAAVMILQSDKICCLWKIVSALAFW